jgi:UPF0716 family protein affecting phage T7 exclusion
MSELLGTLVMILLVFGGPSFGFMIGRIEGRRQASHQHRATGNGPAATTHKEGR